MFSFIKDSTLESDFREEEIIDFKLDAISASGWSSHCPAHDAILRIFQVEVEAWLLEEELESEQTKTTAEQNIITITAGKSCA